jgi:hypothetical protein
MLWKPPATTLTITPSDGSAGTGLYASGPLVPSCGHIVRVTATRVLLVAQIPVRKSSSPRSRCSHSLSAPASEPHRTRSLLRVHRRCATADSAPARRSHPRCLHRNSHINIKDEHGCTDRATNPAVSRAIELPSATQKQCMRPPSCHLNNMLLRQCALHQLGECGRGEGLATIQYARKHPLQDLPWV